MSRPPFDPRNYPGADGKLFGIPYRQAVAPPGGYPEITPLRYLPWNINGFLIIGGALAVYAAGQYALAQRAKQIRFFDHNYLYYILDNNILISKKRS